MLMSVVIEFFWGNLSALNLSVGRIPADCPTPEMLEFYLPEFTIHHLVVVVMFVVVGLWIILFGDQGSMDPEAGEEEL